VTREEPPVPILRPADDHDKDPPHDDDWPRRRRRRDDTSPVAKAGGGRLVPILLMVGVGLLVLVCGGGGVVMYYLSGPRVEMLDGSRDTNPQGGTAAVKLTLRVAADSPGRQVRGKYYFVFSAGTRTAVADANVVGRGGVEFRQTFITPELATEAGPVTFWVEQRDGDSVSRVSPEYTIP
jgi:hypothetical protein